MHTKLVLQRVYTLSLKNQEVAQGCTDQLMKSVSELMHIVCFSRRHWLRAWKRGGGWGGVWE